MPRRAIIESRPWLLASCALAVAYGFLMDDYLPGLLLAVLKMAAVGLLAVYSYRRLRGSKGHILAAAFALCAMGDLLIEAELLPAGLAFLIGHLFVAWIFLRHRRERLASSQKLLAIVLTPFAAGIAYALPAMRDDALPLAIYCGLLGVVAALAWTSAFPRYRVGAGAMLLVLASLLFAAMLGPLDAVDIMPLLIWVSYYLGQFLIATGVVRTLRRMRHATNP